MFSMAEFYRYCKQNDIEIMPFAALPRSACTVRDGTVYAVVLNFDRLRTVRQARTVMAHESGHLHTGALHKVSSPFQLVAQSEHRADVDSFQRYLPPEEIRQAMQKGYTETWQLADYFDLDEDYIKKALHYWTECRDVDFNQRPDGR